MMKLKKKPMGFPKEFSSVTPKLFKKCQRITKGVSEEDSSGVVKEIVRENYKKKSQRNV